MKDLIKLVTLVPEITEAIMTDIVLTSALLSNSNSSKLNVLGDNTYQIETTGGSSIIIEVLKLNLEEKTMTIRSNHRSYTLVFKDELDLVLDKMGIKRSADVVNKHVKAPMPGKVLELLAKEGDQLLKGDSLLILEAMKMENLLKAEANCTVKKIHVNKLENVEKNQVLVELDFAD